MDSRRCTRLASILVLVAALTGPSFARADDHLRVGRFDGQVWVGYAFDTLFDEEVWSSLRSGLPSRIRHRVTLWQDRSPLWDKRVEQWTGSYRVVYDLIEQTYDLFDEEGLLESNLDPPEVLERVAAAPEIPLAGLDRLSDGGSFYVEVWVEVQPLTVEEVRDLERWLSGRIRGRDGLGRLSSQVIGMFKSRVGLGERGRTLRSTTWKRRDLSRFEFDEDPRR